MQEKRNFSALAMELLLSYIFLALSHLYQVWNSLQQCLPTQSSESVVGRHYDDLFFCKNMTRIELCISPNVVFPMYVEKHWIVFVFLKGTISDL